MNLATGVTLAVVVASIVLMLLRPRGIAEVVWVAGGAILLVLAQLLPWGAALKAVAKGADVYFFLVGMMLLSELARVEGVFDWLSSWAVRSARRSRVRLFTTVYVIGTLVTVFMSNDATAVVLTPAILAAVRKAKVPALPYLFVCALIANAASFVLPISNPANLVVFRGGMPTLLGWLQAFALPSLLSIGVTYAVLRVHFRRELSGTLGEEVEAVSLGRGGRWTLFGLGGVVAVLLSASAYGQDLGIPTFAAAAGVAGAVSLAKRKNPLPLARAVSWSTLGLVAALFVLVEALVHVGALRFTAQALGWAASLPRASGLWVTAFSVGVGNNLVNNLPLGLITGATIQAVHPSADLTRALLLGVDLGPNLALSGSLATILWLLALRREQQDVGFWQFFRVGLVVMPTALAAATFGLWLLH